MTKFSDITSFGYSQFVEVDLGICRMVIISGQVPLDDNGAMVGVGNFGVQADLVYSNLLKYVHKAGGKAEHIVKLNTYLTDVSNLPELRTIRDKYVNKANPPASTSVEVTSLFRKEVLIEIEATVIIPK
ncbi:MAG: RidA family protein [Chryseolinea sp.]